MTKSEETIGLLFTHGIGEQKRFEFLKASVLQFAELMKQCGDGDEKFTCTLIDRTADWKAPPGEPDPKGPSPITLTLESTRRRLIFECREVWWADLGARSDIFDSIKFWIWGFGQWCAPIYRDLDAADLEKSCDARDGQKLTKPATRLAKLPESVAGLWWPEIRTRIMLGLAGLATMFVAISWVIAKRLFSSALKTAPTPTLLVSYVGDVRTYEERATPGDTALSDPAYPRRVGIRRRMVTEMVAMGSRDDLDRWYVIAHSQGTVVAYNGLTEIGHTLPNYLTETQWNRLPPEYRTDPGCDLRSETEIAGMMPGRPPWLAYGDLINRPLLFKKLAGFLTYGSPLNKFAAIWPRIVATATDRKDETEPFGSHCLWLNLAARQDPVAGDVSRFFKGRADRPNFDGCVPYIKSIQTPVRPNILISHLRYFDVAEDFEKSRPAITQRHTVMRWLMNAPAEPAEPTAENFASSTGRSDRLQAAFYYTAAIFLTLCAATAFVTLGGNLLGALFFTKQVKAFASVGAFFTQVPHNLLWLLDAALAILSLAGFWRWMDESIFNARTASASNATQVAKLNRAQLSAALCTILSISSFSAIAWVFARGTAQSAPVALLALTILTPIIAILVQCFVNRRHFVPLRYAREDTANGPNA